MKPDDSEAVPSGSLRGTVEHVKDLPDPTRLRLLVDVAHHGSIAGAARANAITASAVSQQLTTLERSIIGTVRGSVSRQARRHGP